MAAKKKQPGSFGGKFIADAPTPEQWAEAIAECERMGLKGIFLIGEKADGTTGIININMASVNHLAEVGDRAMNSMPSWD